MPATAPPAASARRDAAIVASVALACAASWLVVFHPGFMSADSASQLMQARRGVVADWHAPIMTALWSVTDRVVAGPAGMLVVQTTALWSGLALLAARIAAPVGFKVAFLLVLAVAPPIVSIAGAIWKDVLMTAFLVLACGLARRGVAFWPVALLATMSRHNAFVAVAPIVLLHVAPGRPSWGAAVRALGATAALVVAALLGNAALSDVRSHPAQVFATGDVIGIAVLTGNVPAVEPCQVRDLGGGVHEVPHDGEPKLRAADLAARTTLKFCDDERATRTLARRWLDLVAAHPAEYARVRAKLSRRLLGIDETPFNFAMAHSTYATSDARGIDPPPAPSAIQERFGMAIWNLRLLGVFRPWIYGVLGVVAGVLAALRRRWRPCCIALSGSLSELALFLVAPAPEYRYSYWMIVAALIAATWLAVETIGSRRQRAIV